MSDRIFAYTVLLESTFKDEYAERISQAISMIKGVAEVSPQVADPGLYFAQESAKRQITEKLFDALK
jgi:hypothetical protein